jgi:hypothetical protein
MTTEFPIDVDQDIAAGNEAYTDLCGLQYHSFHFHPVSDTATARLVAVLARHMLSNNSPILLCDRVRENEYGRRSTCHWRSRRCGLQGMDDAEVASGPGGALQMKAAHFFAALAVMLLLTAGASAQNRHDQQFNEHDRQVTQDWYNQHQNHAPIGLRSQDRLTPDQEQRFQSGQPLDRAMQRRFHSVPRDLNRRLSPAPRHHKYVVVGQHVALYDTRNHVVRDVIHLHDRQH